MSIGPAPDWTNVTWFVGDFDGTPKLIAVNTEGKIVVELQGEGPTGLQTIAIDGEGQLYALIKGSDGEDVAVDVSGFFTVIMKGWDGLALQTLAVDDAGNLIALMKGQGPTTLETIATDEDGRMITVIRDPTSDNYIAIDSSGQIVAVMKGWDGSALQSIAVDDDGREIAILTDPEDVWGVFRAMGLGELAARVGPQIPADRRGDVVYQDDFESGVGKWVISGSGTGYEVVPSPDLARSGAYSAKLVGGSSATRFAQIARRLPFQVKGLMGMEAHLALVSDVEVTQIWYYIYDGTNYSQFALQLDPVNNEIHYYTTGPTWTKLVDKTLDLATDAGFIPVKMVMDTVNDVYIRAIINGEEHLMTDLVPYTGTISGMKYSNLTIHLKSTTGNNGVGHLDDILITQNEPANPT